MNGYLYFNEMGITNDTLLNTPLLILEMRFGFGLRSRAHVMAIKGRSAIHNRPHGF